MFDQVLTYSLFWTQDERSFFGSNNLHTENDKAH